MWEQLNNIYFFGNCYVLGMIITRHTSAHCAGLPEFYMGLKKYKQIGWGSSNYWAKWWGSGFIIASAICIPAGQFSLHPVGSLTSIFGTLIGMYYAGVYGWMWRNAPRIKNFPSGVVKAIRFILR